MASVPNQTKFHFTHPNHPLLYHSDSHHDYICDGCKTPGSGGRFRCHSCNFDLHEYCTDCPDKLSSSIHHNHHLTLVLRKPSGARLNERICDVCRDPVEGLFYRCKDCDFDAHPLCTQLPKELRHVADNKHSLKLQKLPYGSCSVCKQGCSSLWVYGCEICRVNIHLDCLIGPDVSPPSQTTSRGIRPSWTAGPPPFPGGDFPWNSGGFPYGNYGMGGHNGVYGYAAPYSVPDYHFMYPNYGFVHSNGNHQTSEAVNAAQPPPSASGGKPGKSMFALVGRLTVGVMSSVIFGFPIGF